MNFFNRMSHKRPFNAKVHLTRHTVSLTLREKANNRAEKPEKEPKTGFGCSAMLGKMKTHNILAWIYALGSLAHLLQTIQSISRAAGTNSLRFGRVPILCDLSLMGYFEP